jgi:GH15 family glucan-1,4-alpha-glucosidase
MSLTLSSDTSTPALYLSNWRDLVGIWKASKLSQLDTSGMGPRLSELHYLRGSFGRRSVNQIVDYTGFFRDESAGISYTQADKFATEAWFESGVDDAGILTTNYLSYDGVAQGPRLRLSRSFAAPPNQPFFVVKYTLTNPGAQSITCNILDQVHLNNLQSDKDMHAWYDPAKSALIADMTASGQLFIVLGAFDAVDGYQAADNSATTGAAASGWCTFDVDGTLRRNADVRASDVALAFNKRVSVGGNTAVEVYFYIGVCDTEADVDAAIAAARSCGGKTWMQSTAAAYNEWLNNGNFGRRVHFEDGALNLAFDRSLIVLKNVQNPAIGTFAATTNPIAYGYKTWVRDASTAAMALDACGHHAEAERYWRWMAGSQGSDGTWKTTYDAWDGSYVGFVEPEYDSIGAFIYGVYRHYTFTTDATFLVDLWPNVRRAADWIVNNIQPNGFGHADYSIWEEGDNLEHNSYTQSWYVAGLYATQALAEILGDTSLTEWYAGGAASIVTALQRPSNWFPAGMWNPAGYYNRAVNADDTARTLVDSSSDMLLALGIIDWRSQRAASHVATVLRTITKDTYGLARYPGDAFYYTGAWSPGGNEALASEPSWPQMSLWVAVYDIMRGTLAAALPRLQWCCARMGKGYMPPGEAVSNVTRQPLLSSMSEPLTASAFLLAALSYEGQTRLTVVPPLFNAGAAKSIGVAPGASGDGVQWTNVPYFCGAEADTAASRQYAIERAYVTNDFSNLYVRIDNASRSLPRFAEDPAFALHVYTQDFSGRAATTNFGIDGQGMKRPVSYLVERSSTGDGYRRWSVANGAWIAGEPIAGVIEPQWDPATGRIEAVIPIAAVASDHPSFGYAWADVIIALAERNGDTWVDQDRILLHYRLSTPDQPWIFGNIEQ